MTDPRSGAGLTDKQKETLAAYEARVVNGPKPLTPNQLKELETLRKKRDVPPWENLSETCIKELTKIFIKVKYGREKDVRTKYMIKGLLVEEDSLTLYSRVTKIVFNKNTVQLENEFITGTPDVIDNYARDVKSSWDIWTFFETLGKDLIAKYFYQIQGYIALTNLPAGRLAYCLVNTPDVLIQDEKRKLFYKMNSVSMESPEYLEACEALERELIYDDIPLAERLNEIEVPRDEEAIAAIYNRVELCRKYWDIHFAPLLKAAA